MQTAITMGQVAEPYIPLKAIRHLEKGRVVIFGAGAGMPYFSTDTVSIQRSLEIHCDEVLMGKNGVDGVYTADPRKDENAKRFATLSYNRALVDNLAVMDAAALSMARDNKQLRTRGRRQCDPGFAGRGDRHHGFHRGIHPRRVTTFKAEYRLNQQY